MSETTTVNESIFSKLELDGNESHLLQLGVCILQVERMAVPRSLAIRCVVDFTNGEDRRLTAVL